MEMETSVVASAGSSVAGVPSLDSFHIREQRETIERIKCTGGVGTWRLLPVWSTAVSVVLGSKSRGSATNWRTESQSVDVGVSIAAGSGTKRGGEGQGKMGEEERWSFWARY